MRFLCVLMASVLVLDLPVTAAVEAQNVTAKVDNRAPAAPGPGKSRLIADCTETVIVPSPLPPRPTLRRATFAARPSVPHRHHAHARHKLKPKPHVRHKAVRHGHHHGHRHGHRRPRHRSSEPALVLHRVTYASPLCGQRSPALNAMLGLPDYEVTQPPIAADSDVLPTYIDLPAWVGPGPIGGGGPVGPGPIIGFPGGPIIPIYPVGPGPIVIIVPPGPPVTPPVTPPVIPLPAPEPTSWATMLIGMMMVGRGMRRSAARKTTQ